jgi:hypothetical protein
MRKRILISSFMMIFVLRVSAQKIKSDTTFLQCELELFYAFSKVFLFENKNRTGNDYIVWVMNKKEKIDTMFSVLGHTYFIKDYKNRLVDYLPHCYNSDTSSATSVYYFHTLVMPHTKVLKENIFLQNLKKTEFYLKILEGNIEVNYLQNGILSKIVLPMRDVGLSYFGLGKINEGKYKVKINGIEKYSIKSAYNSDTKTQLKYLWSCISPLIVKKYGLKLKNKVSLSLLSDKNMHKSAKPQVNTRMSV